MAYQQTIKFVGTHWPNKKSKGRLPNKFFLSILKQFPSREKLTTSILEFDCDCSLFTAKPHVFQRKLYVQSISETSRTLQTHIAR